MCEGYMNIMGVINVWLNEKSNISKYQRNKNTTFQSKSGQILSFHVRLTKRVLYEELNQEFYMCVKVMWI